MRLVVHAGGTTARCAGGHVDGRGRFRDIERLGVPALLHEQRRVQPCGAGVHWVAPEGLS